MSQDTDVSGQRKSGGGGIRTLEGIEVPNRISSAAPSTGLGDASSAIERPPA